jgi:Tfp pilus assembly protein PilO
MADELKVPGWAAKVVPAVVVLVVMTVSFLAWGDNRFVTRVEWQHAEATESKEVRETADSLGKHIEQTRLDAVRLGTIEAQLVAIREDLSWFRRRLEKEQKGVQ